jgi:hypothetical protein
MRLFISHFEQFYQINIISLLYCIVLCTEIILLHHMDTYFLIVTVWGFVYMLSFHNI